MPCQPLLGEEVHWCSNAELMYNGGSLSTIVISLTNYCLDHNFQHISLTEVAASQFVIRLTPSLMHLVWIVRPCDYCPRL